MTTRGGPAIGVIALLVLLVAGCGGSDGDRLTVEEYARLCGGEWNNLVEEGFDADSADEARGPFRRFQSSTRAVEPPRELDRVHDVLRDMADDLVDLVEDEGVFEQFFRLIEIASEYETRIDEAAADLPSEVYDTLDSYDCL